MYVTSNRVELPSFFNFRVVKETLAVIKRTVLNLLQIL